MTRIGPANPNFRNRHVLEHGDAVIVLVKHAIEGIEAGRDEIRPGLAKVLGVMSRVAPNFMMAQIAKMSAPKQQKNIAPLRGTGASM